MKTTVLVLLAILTFVINSFSQVSEAWRTSYTQEVESRIIGSKVDNSNNVIVGSSISRSGIGEYANFVIVKFNPAGDTLWRREYHSYGNQHDHLFDIYVDAQGNIYATGLSTDYNAPYNTTRTIKYSPTGNLLWEAVDTTNSVMAVNGISKEGFIREDAGGDIYVCTNKQTHVYVIRYTPAGNVVWERSINIPAVFNNRTLPRAFEINNSGLFIFVTGVDINFTEHVLGIKCNFLGDTLWTWRNNFGNTFLEAARTMTLDAQGNIYYLTELLINFQTSRLAIYKFGSPSWVKFYGDGTQDVKITNSDIKCDNSGNLILTTGHSYLFGFNQHKYEAVTVKYNSIGDSLWGRKLKGSNIYSTYPSQIKIDNNNFIYITGSYPLSTTTTQYLQKYSPIGDSLWNFNIQNVTYWSTGEYVNIDNNGSAIVSSSRMGGFMISKFDNATSVTQIGFEVPETFALSQNYPNPFNPNTVINYQLSIINNVSLKIFDINGKEIETLVNQKQGAGTYSVEWNASNYTSGIYFYKLNAGKFSETKKMMLVK